MKPGIHVTNSADETFALASSLAGTFQGEEVVLLSGDLGSGKTVFAKGLASGLGVEDIRTVTSPSYTLVNIYEARFRIFHIDLYRLDSAAEILDLGWEDYLGRGVVVVEWADKLPFPIEDAVRVDIAVDDRVPDKRIIDVRI